MAKSELAARVVLVTAPDTATAEALVRRLVEERIVACGNILPVTSIYRWRDGVEHEAESLIVFKTDEAGADRVVARVPELHPYEVPEILVLPVAGGHRPYLEWVHSTVGDG